MENYKCDKHVIKFTFGPANAPITLLQQTVCNMHQACQLFTLCAPQERTYCFKTLLDKPKHQLFYWNKLYIVSKEENIKQCLGSPYPPNVSGLFH